VTFTVLGSGTALPTRERGPAGFLVQSNGHDVLVDGGSGTLQRLARAGVEVATLSAGVYSHRHVDHTGDLVPLLFAFRVAGRQAAYPIYAGEGFTPFLAGLREVYGTWIEGFEVPVSQLSLKGKDRAALPGDVVLDSRPAAHSAGALHLAFTGPAGERVVFSGDTGESPALADLASGADLLVCECAVEAVDPRNAHLWPEAVAAIVDQARPARVVLTHLYDETDPERALRIVGASGVPVHRAVDGDAFGL